MQIYAEVFQLRSHVVPNGEVTHKTTQLTSCEMWQSVPWALRGVAASSAHHTHGGSKGSKSIKVDVTVYK
jgi:ribosomal protein L2